MEKKRLSIPVSSIEFDKVYRVMDKRKSLGYSDRDLSFLLGYRALYVRDVENPLHTLRYTTVDTNYLLKIFDCKLSEIMAGIIPEAFYHIEVKVLEHEKNIAYKIYQGVSPRNFDLFREFTYDKKEDIDNVNDPEIEEAIQFLFNGGFFDEVKTAFEIFRACKEKIDSAIAPSALENTIGIYTAKRKAPRLIKDKNESRRIVYKREF